jgi:hypothetical protein
MEANMTNEIVEIIKDLGFPIAVALWFMFRTDKKLDKVIELLHKTVYTVEEISEEIENEGDKQ